MAITPEPHVCARCGETYTRTVDKGQAASWCKPCRNEYMRRYMRSWSSELVEYECRECGALGEKKRYIKRSLCEACTPKRNVQPKPVRSPRWCAICGASTRNPTTCGDPECRAEQRRRWRQTPKGQAYRRSHTWSRRRIGYLARRDGWRCQLCGRKINPDLRHPHPRSASVDHIVPVALGGTDDRSNLHLAHFACNTAKGTRAQGEQLRLVG